MNFMSNMKYGKHCPDVVEIRIDNISASLGATLRQLGWINAPHTQNIEILKSQELTKE
jgi:hypothetical protein